MKEITKIRARKKKEQESMKVKIGKLKKSQ